MKLSPKKFRFAGVISIFLVVAALLCAYDLSWSYFGETLDVKRFIQASLFLTFPLSIFGLSTGLVRPNRF